MRRPPGHYTSLIRDLERWRKARLQHNLDVNLLDRAIAYLTEARDEAPRIARSEGKRA